MRKRLARAPLVLTFGLLSLVAMSVVAAVLQHILRMTIEERAIGEAIRAAEFAAHVGLEPVLPDDTVGRVLDDKSRRAVDEAVASGLANGVLTRVKVFDRNGMIVYSDNPDALGVRTEPSAFLQRVIDEGVPDYKFADVDRADHSAEREMGRLMEVFVPLKPKGGGPVTVVAELYVPFDRVERAVAHDGRRLVVGLLLGLAFLWLVLFRLVQVASRRLRRELERNEHQALHDSLTGLPNRAYLVKCGHLALARGRRNGHAQALLLIDLDKFKEINDTLGHRYGDELLKQVGPRLNEVLRETDTVARLGGDEFAVLLADVEGFEAALAAAERVRDVLHRPFVVDEVTLDVEASIGLAVAPQHGTDLEELLRNADIAMYVSKESKSGPVLFTPADHTASPSRLTLLGDLRRAVDSDGELFLHYQPKLALSDERVYGVEALLRWQHPERGLVPPGEFIGVAEGTGLIVKITERVLDLALGQARRWYDDGHEVPIAVNLSPRCLLDTLLPQMVVGLLNKHGVPARLLRLEITETAIMADATRAMDVLQRLHAAGVRMSIDDFGTGYSSMAYLKRLPVDELKIDRSFVMEMADHENDAVLVRTAIDLGHNLGMTVVAEGVETQDHVDALRALGCDIAQGFHYARPMLAADVDALLAPAGSLAT